MASDNHKSIGVLITELKDTIRTKYDCDHNEITIGLDSILQSVAAHVQKRK